MRRTKRAVLDFPYYMQSARSVRSLYPEFTNKPRAGCCLSHHSRNILRDSERVALERIGPVRTEWKTIADIHRAELQSSYFVVLPDSKSSVGVALIEAISAGCLVLAPSSSVSGYPDLLSPELAFSGFDELLELIGSLENDPHAREQYGRQQERRVEEWCFQNPARNLETMLQAFRASAASPRRQRRAEIRSRARASMEIAAMRGVRRLRRAQQSRGPQ